MELVSLRGYARHRGVSLRAVQKTIASGRIPMNCANHTGEVGVIGVQAAPIATRMNQAAEPVEPTQS